MSTWFCHDTDLAALLARAERYARLDVAECGSRQVPGDRQPTVKLSAPGLTVPCRVTDV